MWHRGGGVAKVAGEGYVAEEEEAAEVAEVIKVAGQVYGEIIYS